ncbi:FKBP-type peptidyl-prolyl cis-trans isomerase [Halogeometricum limi]|uniref:Peptidyl-prolyl cis-trans isomerase n=1 Tax=Halogeometricum limi TaxID=555875 RepID=A0A1I6IEX3_9EURY|nr:peptidylprolyl isomerase [Halogeometricum limi]SFR65246.1 peptidyl-prolyl cis-trans isomerase B (cyclophilin B) [Halogeometricum limi]
MNVDTGDTVRLEYTGRFEGGSVFTTSDSDVAVEHGLVSEDGASVSVSPLQFTVGRGEVIDGLDRAVRGMEPGEEKTVTVPPEDAYGEYDEDRVRRYDPEAFEEMVGEPPRIGDHVRAQNDLHGDVTAVSEDGVEVDFNHELAGKTLVFEIRLVSVE